MVLKKEILKLKSMVLTMLKEILELKNNVNSLEIKGLEIEYFKKHTFNGKLR